MERSEWSFTRYVCVSDDPRLRLSKVASRYFLIGAATPPYKGGDWTRACSDPHRPPLQKLRQRRDGYGSNRPIELKRKHRDCSRARLDGQCSCVLRRRDGG